MDPYEIDRKAGTNYGGPYSTLDYGSRMYLRSLAAHTLLNEKLNKARANMGPEVVGPYSWREEQRQSRLGTTLESLSAAAAKLFLVFALLIVAAVSAFLGPSLLTMPSTSGLDARALMEAPVDASFYVTEDPRVLELAQVPASRLYASYLDGASDEWRTLSEQQQLAIEAAWLRYVKDPPSFDKLQQRIYFKHAFDSFLLNRGYDTGSAQPLIDRGKLHLVDHEMLALARWSQGSLVLREDPQLAAIAMEQPLLGRVEHLLSRGFMFWLDLFMDEDPAEIMLTPHP